MKKRRPTVHGPVSPCNPPKQFTGPRAHLARLDNRHTEAFITSGSGVSILFTPASLLPRSSLSLSRALFPSFALALVSLPETNPRVRDRTPLSLHTLITTKGLARELFFVDDRAGLVDSLTLSLPLPSSISDGRCLPSREILYPFRNAEL